MVSDQCPRLHQDLVPLCPRCYNAIMATQPAAAGLWARWRYLGEAARLVAGCTAVPLWISGFDRTMGSQPEQADELDAQQH